MQHLHQHQGQHQGQLHFSQLPTELHAQVAYKLTTPAERASLASTCRTLRSSSKAASISWYTAGQGEPLEVNVCSPEKVASFLRLLQSYRGIGAGLLHTPLVLRVYDVEKESYNAIEFEDGIDDLPVGADVAATMIPAIFDELAAMQLRELEYYSRLPFDCGLLNSPDFGSLRSLDMLLDNDILCVCLDQLESLDILSLQRYSCYQEFWVPDDSDDEDGPGHWDNWPLMAITDIRLSPSVTAVNLNFVLIEDPPAFLHQIKGLQSLAVTESRLGYDEDNDLVPALMELQLSSLTLWQCAFQLKAYPTTLRELSIDSPYIEDDEEQFEQELLRRVAPLTRLTELNLVNCGLANRGALTRLLEGLPSLQRAELSDFGLPAFEPPPSLTHIEFD